MNPITDHDAGDESDYAYVSISLFVEQDWNAVLARVFGLNRIDDLHGANGAD